MSLSLDSLLATSGLVSQDELRIAREAHLLRGGTILEYLVLGGFVDDEELTAFLRARLLIKRVHPNTLLDLRPSVIALVPEDMAVELRVIPLSTDSEGNIHVVVGDPTDDAAVAEIGFFTSKYVIRTIATQRQLAWALGHYYGIITPLGETLLEPDDKEPAPAEHEPAPRTKGLTGPVSALRRRALVPDASEAPRPTPAPSESLGATRPAAQASNQLPMRSGEVEIPVHPDHVTGRLPAVMVEPEDGSTGVPQLHEGTDTTPILLTTLSAKANPPRDSGPVVLLTNPKQPRTRRITDAGVGVLRARPPGSEPSNGVPQVTSPSQTLPFSRPVSEDSPPARQIVDHQDSSVYVVSKRAKKKKKSRKQTSPASGPSRSDVSAIDEGWDVGDDWSPAAFAAKRASHEPAAAVAEAPVAAPAQESHADAAAAPAIVATPDEMAAENARLMDAVKKLNQTEDRNEVFETLIDHLHHLCDRVAFFAIKKNAVCAWKSRGVNGAGNDKAAVSIDDSAVFSQVVSEQQPFNGPDVDAAAKTFLADAMGSEPSDILAMPVAIGGRVIGVLYGDTKKTVLFDQQLSVVTHTAGMALERIIKAKKAK